MTNYRRDAQNRLYATLPNNRRVYVYKQGTTDQVSPNFRKQYREGNVKNLPANFPYAYNKFTKRFVDADKLLRKDGRYRKFYQDKLETEAREKIATAVRQRRQRRQIRLVYQLSQQNVQFNTFDMIFSIIGVTGDLDAVLIQKLLEINTQDPSKLMRLIVQQGDRIWSTKLGTVDEIIDQIQSGEPDYPLQGDGERTATIQTRGIPQGGNFEKISAFLEGRTGYTTIKNDDNLCGQRCLTAHEIMTKKPAYWKDIKKGRRDMKNQVEAMCVRINKNDRMEVTDFERYEESQVVFIADDMSVWYKTSVESTNKIYMYFDFVTKHYYLIHNINTFANKEGNYKWCNACDKRLLKKYHLSHKCTVEKCKCCYTTFDTACGLKKHFEAPKWVCCTKCNMPCPSHECLDTHTSKCKGQSWRCSTCRKWVDISRKDEHKCTEIYCKNCDIYHEDKEHRCFITPLEFKQTKVQPSYYVYDFESIIEPTSGVHTVNLCVVNKLYDDDFQEIFSTIDDFVKWVLKQKNCYMYAHNGKAYDNWLVHSHIIKHTGERPKKLITAGNKIMKMTINTVHFHDSINHIASSLDGLPTMFGLDTSQFKKGFFPYTFNTHENQKYIGNIPAVKYFEPDSMMPLKRKEFYEWYASQKHFVYDFEKELTEYCISDVKILKGALQVYRDNAIDFNQGLDPMTSTTIASYCMKVFRTNCLQEETIAVLNKSEYEFCKRGFCGGRTNALCLYKKWTPEQIAQGTCGRYMDIQSLYPTVQFYDDMPTGIPTWIDGSDVNIDTVFGYVECDVVPPNNLYHPVLPERRDGKLLFDLLPKEKQVFTSVELKKAIQCGYKITRIYKALAFEKSATVFRSYVANLLKMKVEASGTKLTGEALEAFVYEHKQRFGFDINVDNLAKNAGMRALMKIQLNSLWGKLGQRYDMKQSVYYTEPKNWFDLIKRHKAGKIELKNEISIDNRTLFVEYVDLEEENTSLVTTNVAMAGFTTSHARLRLYKEMERLGTRVIYHDTDSIIYEHQKNAYNIPEGKYLGEWECETDGKPITEFVSIGPKSYGYKYEGKVETKFKGFTLNYTNSQAISFDTIKQLIDGTRTSLNTETRNFKRDKKNGTITTEMQSKEAGFVYAKAQIVNKYNTVPYGWGVAIPAF